MAGTDIEPLIAQIRKRWSEIKTGDHRDEYYIEHLRSLGRYRQEPMDYPDVTAEYPPTIDIAYAVCHPECGVREFIVEGSTQECCYCGGAMFRIDRRKYKLIEEQDDA